MMEISVVQILWTLASVALLALLTYVARVGVAWLRARVGEAEFDAVTRYVRQTVDAAEQLYKSGQLKADERYQFVLHALKQYFPDLDEEEIDILIEAAVFNLNLAFGTLLGEQVPAEPVPAPEVFTHVKMSGERIDG